MEANYRSFVHCPNAVLLAVHRVLRPHFQLKDNSTPNTRADTRTHMHARTHTHQTAHFIDYVGEVSKNQVSVDEAKGSETFYPRSRLQKERVVSLVADRAPMQITRNVNHTKFSAQ